MFSDVLAGSSTGASAGAVVFAGSSAGAAELTGVSVVLPVVVPAGLLQNINPSTSNSPRSSNGRGSDTSGSICRYQNRECNHRSFQSDGSGPSHRPLQCEDEVKKKVHSDLQQIKEDITAVLRNTHFRTARNELDSWSASEEPVTSKYSKDRLQSASEHAVMAFADVPDPLDKLTSALFSIFAGYQIVALDYSPPNWKRGKREAQLLLEHYAK